MDKKEGERKEEMRVKVGEIKVKEGRVRKQISGVEELAESIKEYGLLQPIVVDEEMNLVAGERRLRAIKHLGWEEVEVVKVGEVEDWRKVAMEVEENIRRSNLTWQEEVAGKLLIHNLYQQKYGQSIKGKKDHGWTIDDTAELLGESHGSVATDILLAKAIEANPDLAKRETKTQAIKAMQREKELAILKAVAETSALIASSRKEEDIQILSGDSAEVLKGFEDESFDFCITDPPYGIQFQNVADPSVCREVKEGVLFEDKIGVLEKTVKPVMQEVYRVLKQGSHCYMFFSIARYPIVVKMMEEIGFWVCSTPLFWIKNNGYCLRPFIVYPVNYEPVLYCAKGYPPRKIVKHASLSTFFFPIPTRKEHPTEKPVEVYKWLLEHSTVEGERGLDPFVGSGNFCLAVKEMKRRGVGIDIDRVWVEKARIKVFGRNKEEEKSEEETK